MARLIESFTGNYGIILHAYYIGLDKTISDMSTVYAQFKKRIMSITHLFNLKQPVKSFDKCHKISTRTIYHDANL